jgi:HPt (histidine-containing phosphotransfer) domain-containing protein
MTILPLTEYSTLPSEEKNASDDRSKTLEEQRINLDGLLHISGGDEQFIRQMLLSFILTTEEGLKEIREDVADEKWEAIANLAHKLLPPSRHIGAVKLSSILRKIEENAMNRTNKKSVESLAAGALAEFNAVAGLLKDYISKLK